MSSVVANIFSNSPDRNGSVKKYLGDPVTETLTNGFFTVDKEWTVKYWNKEAEKLLGIKSAEIVGKNIWEKFAGQLPLEFYTVYYKAFLQDIPVHFEEYWGEMGAWFDVITYHCDDTLSVSFKSSNHPHPEYPDSPVKRLKILTELYKYVTEITNDCLWEWNFQSSEIFWIDGGHKRAFGYNIENALIPQSFWESLIHPEDKERVFKKLHDTIRETNFLWEDKYRIKKVNGDYAWVQDRGHVIYDDKKIASRMIGATQDVTIQVLLEHKLAEEKLTRQKEITEAVLTAQENERKIIGIEMHDNLNQMLAISKMYIQQAMKYEDNREIHLEKSYDLIVGVMNEIRKISKNLIIPAPSISSLSENIKNMLEDVEAIHPIKFKLNIRDIDEKKLEDKLQLNIYRIIQEQLNNIIAHSGATQSAITLKAVEGEILLTMSDNGVGYDTDKKRMGVGIRNIMSRAELYNGSVSIDSKPGKGYELKVILIPDSPLESKV